MANKSCGTTRICSKRWPSEVPPKLVVLKLHAQAIDIWGGIHGVRDDALLESALAQPEQTFGGELLHPSVVEAAAAYGFHLGQNHCFVDGNKRIAYIAMETFLRANGRRLSATQSEKYAVMMAVASGQMTKAGLTAWVRRCAVSPETWSLGGGAREPDLGSGAEHSRTRPPARDTALNPPRR